MKTRWYKGFYTLSVEPTGLCYGQEGPTSADVAGGVMSYAEFRAGRDHGWVESCLGPGVVSEILAVLDSVDAGGLFSEDWAQDRPAVEAWRAVPTRADLAGLYEHPDEIAVGPGHDEAREGFATRELRDPGGLRVVLHYGKSYIEAPDGRRAELRSWAPEVLFCEGSCYAREGDTIRVFSPDLTETFPAPALHNTLLLNTNVRLSAHVRKGGLVLARWWSLALPLPVAAVLGERGVFLVGPGGILARSPKPD